MTITVAHRGQDSSGILIDDYGRVSLGHRRLAIRDLSKTGHQPIVSTCGRFVITYNGEVDSQNEVRKALEKRGLCLRGTSDTEIIVEAWTEWGIENTVKRLIGMFAVALFYREARHLFLVRDKLGIKPLYYYRINDLLILGSELKSLCEADGWCPELDRHALSACMRHNYIPAPNCTFLCV